MVPRVSFKRKTTKLKHNRILDWGSIRSSPKNGKKKKVFQNNPTMVRRLVFDNLLLYHVELAHVLDLTVHLVNIVDWMGTRDPFKTFWLSALFHWSASPRCTLDFVLLWVWDLDGLGGTEIGTRAWQFLKISYSLIQAYFEPCSTKYIHAVRSFDIWALW